MLFLIGQMAQSVVIGCTVSTVTMALVLPYQSEPKSNDETLFVMHFDLLNFADF